MDMNNLALLHEHTTGAISAEDLYALILEQKLFENDSEALDKEFKSRFGVDNFSKMLVETPAEAKRVLSEKFHCVSLNENLTNPKEFGDKLLARYGFGYYVTKNPSIRRRLSKQICETMYNQGVKYLELRAVSFKPGAAKEEDTWTQLSESVYGMIDAKNELPGFDFSFIMGIARKHFVDDRGNPDQSKIEQGEKMLKFLTGKLIENPDIGQYVDGMDATDKEVLPPEKMKSMFDITRQAGIASVPHGGENFRSLEDGIHNIRDYIDLLGAKRIGHALAAYVDPNTYLSKKDGYDQLYTEERVGKIRNLQDELLTYMKEKDVAIEICPTSNMITLGLKSYAELPIRRLLEHGVPFMICTDSSGVYGIKLSEEVKSIADAHNLSPAELEKVLDNSHKYSLINL